MKTQAPSAVPGLREQAHDGREGSQMDDAVARGADIRSSLGQRGTPKNGKLGLDQQTWIRAEDWPRCVHTSAGRWPPFRIPCRGENKLPLLTIFLSKSDLCVLHSAHQREITVRIAPGNSNSSWGHADKRCYYIGIHKGLGSIGRFGCRQRACYQRNVYVIHSRYPAHAKASRSGRPRISDRESQPYPFTNERVSRRRFATSQRREGILEISVWLPFHRS